MDAAKRIFSRRRLAGQVFCRPFALAYCVLGLVAAKTTHIHAHRSGLIHHELLKWGLSLYAQDVGLALLLRLLLNGWPFTTRSCTSFFGRVLVGLLASYVAFLSTVTVVFYVVSGAEIHWRNIAFAGDASSRALLLTGVVSLLVVVCVLVVLAIVVKDALFGLLGLGLDALVLPFACVMRRNVTLANHADEAYTAVPQDDVEHGEKRPRKCVPRKLATCLMAGALATMALLYTIRPKEGSLVFLSWTTPLMPLVDVLMETPVLADLQPLYGTSIDRSWDDLTAVSDPIPLPWLPQLDEGKSLAGFDDWYTNGTHYDARLDPMRFDNTKSDVLASLKHALKESPIRHIIVAKMESARKDVFPLKKNEIIWDRFRKTFPGEELPDDVVERLSTLTPTANYITGDYDDGFPHNSTPKRGGLNFNNAFTTCTFTLKSLVGSLCGVTPMLVDFTKEHENHIYQPCLPQIFDVFNMLEHKSKSKHQHKFVKYPWKSYFMQTANLRFDNFDKLVPALGFPGDNIIDRDYLKSGMAKFGFVDLPDVNYFGMVEEPLEPYIRDAFQSAKNNSERVFITHVTSTSHHPYNIPEEETYVPLGKGGALNDLSHYVNAIGYDDRWLGRLMGYLDDEGVANETLLIFVGDHGLSLPENDIPAAYYNPNVGSDHVPFVISHPKMPPITINEAVNSIQILPTILDLLIETGSLSKDNAHAAKDLLHNYEGQSLIRELQKVAKEGKKPQPNWQYTVVNPGGPMIAVREPENPNRRLIVPILENIEWRYTDLESDPAEKDPVLAFSYDTFLLKVAAKYGVEAAKWAENAAFATRWFVKENNKRWRWEG